MNRKHAASRGSLAAALLLATACQATPSTPTLSAEGESERLILVTVANEPAPALRAGSTPRAYDGFLPYGVSTEARKTVAALASDYHLRAVKSWPIATLRVHCIVFEIPAGGSRADLLKLLAQDKRVKLAQPMQTFSTLTQSYNDPYVSLQHGLQDIDVADAHQWSRGESVRVAIIDSGVDISHPDLRDRVILRRNFVDGDQGQFKRDRHGTEVAGVIAAVANNRLGIVGVAPRVALLVFKACWQLAEGRDEARCNSFTLAQALVAAMEAKAQVVNLSLSGPADPLLGILLAQAQHRGMVVIGAAASSAGPPLQFPTNIPGVLCVGSMEERSSTPHALLAPGREILTLLPGGRYDFASGSSLAAAHVTGTIALLLAQHPHLDPNAIYALLERTSTRTGMVQSINACTALASLTAHGSCEPSGAAAALAVAQPALPSPRR